MSSNNEYAIQVQDVSKIYKLYDKPIRPAEGVSQLNP